MASPACMVHCDPECGRQLSRPVSENDWPNRNRSSTVVVGDLTSRKIRKERNRIHHEIGSTILMQVSRNLLVCVGISFRLASSLWPPSGKTPNPPHENHSIYLVEQFCQRMFLCGDCMYILRHPGKMEQRNSWIATGVDGESNLKN